jgi:hypothetical protein
VRHLCQAGAVDVDGVDLAVGVEVEAAGEGDLPPVYRRLRRESCGSRSGAVVAERLAEKQRPVGRLGTARVEEPRILAVDVAERSVVGVDDPRAATGHLIELLTGDALTVWFEGSRATGDSPAAISTSRSSIGFGLRGCFETNT